MVRLLIYPVSWLVLAVCRPKLNSITAPPTPDRLDTALWVISSFSTHFLWNMCHVCVGAKSGLIVVSASCKLSWPRPPDCEWCHMSIARWHHFQNQGNKDPRNLLSLDLSLVLQRPGLILVSQSCPIKWVFMFQNQSYLSNSLTMHCLELTISIMWEGGSRLI